MAAGVTSKLWEVAARAADAQAAQTGRDLASMTCGGFSDLKVP
jgi:hypothetical protein